MKKTILIEKTVIYTSLAILLEGELIAVYVDSNLEPDNQNKIIIGQVDKVVKTLNAVFIDFGDEKKGLLHLTQVPKAYSEKMHQGIRLPVQIAKLGTGEKGHKLTAKISLKGKYLVCLPFETGISVSKKIKSQSLRKTMKEMLAAIAGDCYSFIVRTHAEYVPLEAIRQDALDLIDQASHLMQIKDNLSKGAVLYEDQPIYSQVIAENICAYEGLDIICNDKTIVSQLQDVFGVYLRQDYPIQIVCMNPKEDIYAAYDIQKEMGLLLNRKIWLKNGGNIVIDYTEAMTVIDVNSAKAILSSNHRKSVKELNLLAIKEAILQVVRRNLSGIIILDLVEMPYEEDREEAYHFAKNYINQLGDKRTKVFPVTELGLLQITRTKKYNSIPQKLLKPCGCCNQSTGRLSEEYEAYLLEKKIRHVAYHTINRQIRLNGSKALIDFLNQKNILKMFEDTYSIEVIVEKTEETVKDAGL